MHLLQCCPHITVLQLWDCSAAMAASICAQLTKLSVLRCGAFGTLCGQELQGKCAVELALSKLRSLTELDLTGCTNIPEQVLLSLVTNNPKLEYVNLTGCEGATNAALLQLGKHARPENLRRCALQWCVCMGTNNPW